MADDRQFWSVRRLRAAYWVGHVLGTEGERLESARSSWLALPLAGEVDVRDLLAAEDGLLQSGLLRLEGDLLRPSSQLSEVCQVFTDDTDELILGLVFEKCEPLWLETASGGGDQIAPELIPAEAASVLENVIPDAKKREAFLLARARKVNSQLRESMGAEGEEFVEEECRKELLELGEEELASRVKRVSLISDELGYDITSPRTDSSSRRLEVKTTRSLASTVAVVVTRNEVSVGLADPDWFLVVVHLDRDDVAHIIGHLTASSFEHSLPADCDASGRWQTARIKILVGDLRPGLPPANL